MTYLLDGSAAAASERVAPRLSGGRSADRACRQRRRRIVQFARRDVRVPADRGEIGVAEIGGNETGVARQLPQPRRGGVTEGVRGDALVDRGSPGRATASPPPAEASVAPRGRGRDQAFHFADSASARSDARVRSGGSRSPEPGRPAAGSRPGSRRSSPPRRCCSRDPVGSDRALAPLRRLESAQPVVPCALHVRDGRRPRRLPQFAEKPCEEGDCVIGRRGFDRLRRWCCRRWWRNEVLACPAWRVAGVELDERELPGQGLEAARSPTGSTSRRRCVTRIFGAWTAPLTSRAPAAQLSRSSFRQASLCRRRRAPASSEPCPSRGARAATTTSGSAPAARTSAAGFALPLHPSSTVCACSMRAAATPTMIASSGSAA
jgi:hypothetical protein